MLFKDEQLDAIARGRITVAFRRWKKPTVKAGGTLRTPVGVLSILTVDEIPEHGIMNSGARRAGYHSRISLLADLPPPEEGPIYRVSFRFEGEDPRVKLRKRTRITGDDVLERLVRLDKASRIGPWTRRTLTLIEKYPQRRAADLALKAKCETLAFKNNVRKLKNLGLTESLLIGYRISPRGLAVLKALRKS